jgi:hypothetical protein
MLSRCFRPCLILRLILLLSLFMLLDLAAAFAQVK